MDMERDLVWAKMKGFSPWPGLITEPTPELRKKAPKQKHVKCIFFFGTKNFAWIEDTYIKPFFEFKEQLIKSSKTVAFKEAVMRIEEFISDPVKFKSNAEPPNLVEPRDTDAEFNKLRENDSSIVDEEDGNGVVAADVDAADVSIVVGDGEMVSPTVAAATKTAATSPRRKSLKKKADNPKLKSILVKKKAAAKDNDLASPSSAKRKRYSEVVDANHEVDLTPDEDLDSSYTPSPRRNFAAAQLLNRPALATRPEPAELDMNDVSSTLKMKNINPSALKFGFLGLGIMGSGIVKNLINSGHKVVVWNRTFNKCRKFELAGAEVAPTPCDVIDKVDITFSCVADPLAAKEMVFGNCGILSSEAISDGKGYVEMTGIDDNTSQDIADAIISKGGRYLEAQIQGSKLHAEEGTLIILAAGERSLFDECQTCFEAMGKNSFFLGDVGNASKMYLVLQMISGVTLAGLAEGMALADRAGLQQKDVLEVLEITNMASPMLLDKGNAIVNADYTAHHPLLHMQKDLKLALTLSDTIEQPLPLTATANEVYKHAKRNGYSEHDSSAVYIRSRI